MPTMVEDVAHAYFAALADGKDASRVAEWVSLFAEDGVSVDPVAFPARPENVHAYVQLHGFLTGFFGLFRSIGFSEIASIPAGGDSVAVQWEAKGVGNNGASVTFHGVDVIRIDSDGKIKTVFAFWDPAPVFKAIGAS